MSGKTVWQEEKNFTLDKSKKNVCNEKDKRKMHLRPKQNFVSTLAAGWDFVFNDAAGLYEQQCLFTMQLRYWEHLI